MQQAVNNKKTYGCSTPDMNVGSSSSTAIQAAKQQLRQKIRARLAAIPGHELEAQALAATQRILSHPSYQRANRLSIYISMPSSELQTDTIISDALQQNKKLFVPYTPPGKGSRMEMLRIRDLNDFRKLQPNKWKIRQFGNEIAELAQRENALDDETGQGLDLILMPGLAFDRHLNRLGHGRGYYDTYLSRCALFSQEHGIERPATIALALDEQILDEGETIPALTLEDGHTSGHRDIRPDRIVFPSGELVLDVVEAG